MVIQAQQKAPILSKIMTASLFLDLKKDIAYVMGILKDNMKTGMYY